MGDIVVVMKLCCESCNMCETSLGNTALVIEEDTSYSPRTYFSLWFGVNQPAYIGFRVRNLFNTGLSA